MQLLIIVKFLSYGGNSPKHKKSYGSGIFLLFVNVTVLQLSNFNVSIHYSTFHHNSEYYQSKNTCLADFKHNKKFLPILNAAVLTIFYIQNSFAVNVNVMQSKFISN